MARKAGSNGIRTAAAIRRASLKLIHRHGFAAMSLRDLAAEVGVQPASLYNHIATKQALLFDLVRDHMEGLLASTEAALAAAPPDPLSRIEAFMAHHLLFHFDRKQEVYIANSELRALEGPNRARILALRRRYESSLFALLEAGERAGVVSTSDVKVAAFAILAALTGV
ncbi:MAG TPA: TetR family transcriptional regulator, partial [Acetobacteraceae bacterium]|nr:TetR family transcriptional regulator [Acetobacteraceae bacterium]